MRLLKLVQQRAAISRRKAEEIIRQGRVWINGARATNPFQEITIESIRTLEVNGKEMDLKPTHTQIYKYYKPKGQITTHSDPHHRNTVGSVLKAKNLKGFNIAGRLDKDAQGLLLLTNDGELLNALTHPRFQVEKVYHLTVSQVLRIRQTNDAFRQMEHGLQDDGELLKIKKGKILQRQNGQTKLEITLTEGKKHELKRLCARFGWRIETLKRVNLGPIALGNLAPGHLKKLTPQEAKRLERFIAERTSD